MPVKSNLGKKMLILPHDFRGLAIVCVCGCISTHSRGDGKSMGGHPLMAQVSVVEVTRKQMLREETVAGYNLQFSH